jgi:hypothetical protein
MKDQRIGDVAKYSTTPYFVHLPGLMPVPLRDSRCRSHIASLESEGISVEHQQPHHPMNRG